MLELMNIYKTELKKLIALYQSVCRGSYVRDRDVEGMTGLWWGREGGGEGRKEPEKGGDGKLLQLMICY